MISQFRHYAIFLLLGGVGLLYLLNQSWYSGFHDSLSYVLEAEDGFSLATNATNHFLYSNTGWLLHTLLPFVDTVRLLTLLSIVFSLLALWRIVQIAAVLLPQAESPVVWTLPALLLGLSFTWWQQSEIIEVYTFSSFFLLSFLLEIIRDRDEEGHNRSLRTGIWLGLALITHIQHILAIPLFAYYLFGRKNEAKDPQKWIALIPFVAAWLILLLPVFMGKQEASWIFFDTQFGDEALGFDLMAILKGAVKGIGYFFYNFHIFSFFIFHGIYLAWKRIRPMFWVLLLFLLPYLGFAVKYSVQDNHVFYLSSYLALILFSSLSFNWFWEKKEQLQKWLIAALFLFPVLGYFSAWQLSKKLDSDFLERYQVEKSYKGGVSHLLWPGKSWTGAKDPLEVAKAWCNQAEIAEQEAEWNWPAALHLLEQRGDCPSQSDFKIK